jgi:hypothetical protein
LLEKLSNNFKNWIPNLSNMYQKCIKQFAFSKINYQTIFEIQKCIKQFAFSKENQTTR